MILGFGVFKPMKHIRLKDRRSCLWCMHMRIDLTDVEYCELHQSSCWHSCFSSGNCQEPKTFDVALKLLLSSFWRALPGATFIPLFLAAAAYIHVCIITEQKWLVRSRIVRNLYLLRTLYHWLQWWRRWLSLFNCLHLNCYISYAKWSNWQTPMQLRPQSTPAIQNWPWHTLLFYSGLFIERKACRSIASFLASVWAGPNTKSKNA